MQLEQGFSVSVPFIVTDGPVPTVDADVLATVTSGDPFSVRVVYPDTTDGVANPKRSVRVDALGGGGANIQLSCLGHNAAMLVTVTPAVNRGTSSFGEPGAAFRTPGA